MLSLKKTGSVACRAVVVFMVIGIIPSRNVEAETYSFITKWGSLGSEGGQFNFPSGVAVDSSGNVYVADYFNNRIQKFRPLRLNVVDSDGDGKTDIALYRTGTGVWYTRLFHISGDNP